MGRVVGTGAGAVGLKPWKRVKKRKREERQEVAKIPGLGLSAVNSVALGGRMDLDCSE